MFTIIHQYSPIHHYSHHYSPLFNIIHHHSHQHSPSSTIRHHLAPSFTMTHLFTIIQHQSTSFPISHHRSPIHHYIHLPVTGRSREAQHIHLPVTGRSAKAHYEAPRDIHHYSPFCSPNHGKLEKQLFRVLLHGVINDPDRGPVPLRPKLRPLHEIITETPRGSLILADR